jgi:hypothetical protein
MSGVEERLSRLLALAPAELDALAEHGRVGPAIGAGPQEALIARVAGGRKPAAIDVGVAGACRAKELGLVVKALGGSTPDGEWSAFTEWPDAEGPFSPDVAQPPGFALDYALAENTEAMAELERAYLLQGVVAIGDEASEARLGLALGYSDADVAAFLVRRRRRREAAA